VRSETLKFESATSRLQVRHSTTQPVAHLSQKRLKLYRDSLNLVHVMTWRHPAWAGLWIQEVKGQIHGRKNYVGVPSALWMHV